MSRSRLFLVFVAVGVATVAALVLWAGGEGRRWRQEELPRLHILIGRIGLSDLALWTEARYTRHPSQADLFSAFQDSPGAPEHFPAGSILSPPPMLTNVTVRPRAGGESP